MFIAKKNTKIIAIHQVEWKCRKEAKGLSKTEYWTWLATVTSEDSNGHKAYDFSGEDYEIIETDAPLSYQDKDEDGFPITVTFSQSGHIHSEIDTGQHYHLKWDGSKIVKDDDALSACQTAEKWKDVRRDRNRKLEETDYLALGDNTLTDPYKAYRNELRQVPQSQSDPFKITWPTKPS